MTKEEVAQFIINGKKELSLIGILNYYSFPLNVLVFFIASIIGGVKNPDGSFQPLLNSVSITLFAIFILIFTFRTLDLYASKSKYQGSDAEVFKSIRDYLENDQWKLQLTNRHYITGRRHFTLMNKTLNIQIGILNGEVSVLAYTADKTFDYFRLPFILFLTPMITRIKLMRHLKGTIANNG